MSCEVCNRNKMIKDFFIRKSRKISNRNERGDHGSWNKHRYFFIFIFLIIQSIIRNNNHSYRSLRTGDLYINLFDAFYRLEDMPLLKTLIHI